MALIATILLLAPTWSFFTQDGERRLAYNLVRPVPADEFDAGAPRVPLWALRFIGLEHSAAPGDVHGKINHPEGALDIEVLNRHQLCRLLLAVIDWVGPVLRNSLEARDHTFDLHPDFGSG